ncbi:RHS repeat domain-containing protein, partial [uncultured Microbulbifer sp.]|uniref:RHS repeat domain-containing protein n=1 Tax=uncultured Microbulbifer sp. TaxID=348147 RepID=UPI00262AB3ED
FALYDSAGNRVLEVDRLGYVTEYRYDGLGQITAQTRYADALNFSGLGAPKAADGSEARHAWLDNLYTSNRAALVANIASGDERTTEYVYSGRGLLLEERIKGESFARISNSGTALNVSR